MRIAWIALACLFAMTACSKDKGGDGKAAGEEMPAGIEFAVESGTKNLAEIKEKIKAGKPEDAMFTCAAVKGYMESASASKAKAAVEFVKQAKQVCLYDQPFATVEVGIAALAKKGVKPADFSSDCVKVTMAMEELQKNHAADAKVKGLAEKLKKHCS